MCWRGKRVARFLQLNICVWHVDSLLDQNQLDGGETWAVRSGQHQWGFLCLLSWTCCISVLLAQNQAVWVTCLFLCIRFLSFLPRLRFYTSLTSGENLDNYTSECREIWLCSNNLSLDLVVIHSVASLIYFWCRYSQDSFLPSLQSSNCLFKHLPFFPHSLCYQRGFLTVQQNHTLLSAGQGNLCKSQEPSYSHSLPKEL